jgi:alkanesulfonate monooxygenase SsuD/methylene tetrahydromethanopterin reductase-like flavin-dependent oxidoreductase (luciferase family)
MEFGIFVSTFLPGQMAHDPVAEHEAIMGDLEAIQIADRTGWKYAWVAEHHALTEYSHLSASESFIPYALATTEQIHVGSGIWPLNPVTNHPIRLAERAAILDHLSEGRFEFGTGRGAGSWEVGTFNLVPSETRAVWEEVVWEFKKMWETTRYSHEGPAFSTPPRNILPKPYGGGRTHPPMWVAAGNPPTYEKAARHGMGVLGFNHDAVHALKPAVEAYKAAISEAEPVGQYVNDNVMVTNSLICLPDGREARYWACNAYTSYFCSLLFMYHDTFPKPDWVKLWPECSPEPTMDDIEAAIEDGRLLCGSPDEIIDQVENYKHVGFDQLGFGMSRALPREVIRETIELFGKEVIPHFDTDPVHRTTRQREQSDRVLA